ncbi:LuxR C-terminal-related transcriptional regulator [Aeromicrobium sp. UC242_57]|uniref:LuxR C-terminal-related transcriptional regulator n=1 Tax=Aeromicrobium sp. UC242_57 TaxID=3374624 RepID=UPI00378EE196
MLRDGLSNAEIAHTLVLSPRTVTTHVEHVLRKPGPATAPKPQSSPNDSDSNALTTAAAPRRETEAWRPPTRRA